MAPEGTNSPTEDEKRLAELGYSQDLERGWTRFTNFAISFSIISVLAGCFTTFYVAWNNGGPIAISIGWPVIALIILTVAVSMAELASAYPTAGGPYWWANSLGGPGWSWFTGWFNVLGLIGIVASVDYILSFFLTQLFGLWSLDLGFINFADQVHVVKEIFALFVVILALHALINIFSHRLLALFNSISVFWHVVGVVIIIGILVFVPDHHQSAKFVFTQKINNSGFAGGAIGGGTFWFLVLPVGFLLTMYTITGYDASAHVAEETKGAEEAAAKGVWQSVALSAVIGWFVLLAILFAATNVNAVNEGFGTSIAVFTSAAMDKGRAEAIIAIACVGQFFCGMAVRDEQLRTFNAFSRDRAMPGHSIWSRVSNERRTGQCSAHEHPARTGDHAARVVCLGQVHAPGRILRGHRDRHRRALHRLRDAGVSALARRRLIPAALLEPRAEVEVDQPDSGDLRRVDVHHPLPPVLQPRSPLEVAFPLELLQLHPARGRIGPDRDRPGVGAGREQELQGSSEDDPGGRRHQGLILG